MDNHYVILSSGCYSDYSPVYFRGDREISQEELTKKGKEVGDFVIDELEAIPVRIHKCSDFRWHYNGEGVGKEEKYHPDTGKVAYISSSRWEELMVSWLKSEGFEQLPDKIPEINIEYSDIPTNKYNYKQ